VPNVNADTSADEFLAFVIESRATNPYVHLVLSWRHGVRQCVRVETSGT